MEQEGKFPGAGVRSGLSSGLCNTQGLELFTTRMLSPEQRRAYWCDLVAETFPGMSADAPNGIKADLARWSLGQLGVARAACNRSRVSREHDRQNQRTLVFHLQQRGRMMLRQGHRTSYAGVGDIVMSEEEHPYTIDISNANDCLIVHMPVAMMDQQIGERDWAACVLDGKNPNVRLLSRVLEGVWNERQYQHDLEGGVDTVIANMASIACLGHRVPSGAMFKEPVEFALAHLHDPELGTAVIAEGTGLSTRAVQHAFARHVGCSPSAFVTRQRLARAAEMLRGGDPRSVTQIAFDVGFSDAAFFTRCFTRQFGMPPSQWRRTN